MEPSDRFAITLGEAIYSLRAIRRIKPDPIPDDDLLAVLDAARQAEFRRAAEGCCDNALPLPTPSSRCHRRPTGAQPRRR